MLGQITEDSIHIPELTQLLPERGGGGTDHLDDLAEFIG